MTTNLKSKSLTITFSEETLGIKLDKLTTEIKGVRTDCPASVGWIMTEINGQGVGNREEAMKMMKQSGRPIMITFRLPDKGGDDDEEEEEPMKKKVKLSKVVENGNSMDVAENVEGIIDVVDHEISAKIMQVEDEKADSSIEYDGNVSMSNGDDNDENEDITTDSTTTIADPAALKEIPPLSPSPYTHGFAHDLDFVIHFKQKARVKRNSYTPPAHNLVVNEVNNADGGDGERKIGDVDASDKNWEVLPFPPAPNYNATASDDEVHPPAPNYNPNNTDPNNSDPFSSSPNNTINTATQNDDGLQLPPSPNYNNSPNTSISDSTTANDADDVFPPPPPAQSNTSTSPAPSANEASKQATSSPQASQAPQAPPPPPDLAVSLAYLQNECSDLIESQQLRENDKTFPLTVYSAFKDVEDVHKFDGNRVKQRILQTLTKYFPGGKKLADYKVFKNATKLATTAGVEMLKFDFICTVVDVCSLNYKHSVFTALFANVKNEDGDGNRAVFVCVQPRKPAVTLDKKIIALQELFSDLSRQLTILDLTTYPFPVAIQVSTGKEAGMKGEVKKVKAEAERKLKEEASEKLKEESIDKKMLPFCHYLKSTSELLLNIKLFADPLKDAILSNDPHTYGALMRTIVVQHNNLRMLLQDSVNVTLLLGEGSGEAVKDKGVGVGLTKSNGGSSSSAEVKVGGEGEKRVGVGDGDDVDMNETETITINDKVADPATNVTKATSGDSTNHVEPAKALPEVTPKGSSMDSDPSSSVDDAAVMSVGDGGSNSTVQENKTWISSVWVEVVGTKAAR